MGQLGVGGCALAFVVFMASPALAQPTSLPTLPPLPPPTAPAESESTQATPAEEPATDYAPPVPMVWVHVEGGDGTQLERQLGPGDWLPVCVAPCDTSVPAGFAYRMGGDGVRPSKAFDLTAQPGGREQIAVRPASRAWYVVGVGVTGAGVVVAGVSALGLGFGLLGLALSPLADGNDRDGKGGGGVTNVLVILLAALGGGGAAAGLGAYLIATNAGTSVTQAPLALPVAKAKNEARAMVPLFRLEF